jgi:hypothetical protein
MRNVSIRLSMYEIRQAAIAGLERELAAIVRARQDSNGIPQRDAWGLHIGGCLGEIVVAKWLGVYWDGAFRQKLVAGDVGALEVRYTDWANGRLLIKEKDADDAAYLLVTGPSLQQCFTIRGWIVGGDAKKDIWHVELERGRPCYAVPQDALRSLDSIWGTNASPRALRMREEARAS